MMQASVSLQYSLTPAGSYSLPIMATGQSTAVAALPIDQTIYAARQGDVNAFSLLIELYHTAALRLAAQILRTEEAAADAVQEALLKAHHAMSRFEDGNFRSWLLRIVANTCYDHLRRQKRRQALSLDELSESNNHDYEFVEASNTINPEQSAIQDETMRLILQAIDQLPTWHRSVVTLIDVHGYDYGEVAEMLHLPLGTVKSRLSRARSALRDHLVDMRVVGI